MIVINLQLLFSYFDHSHAFYLPGSKPSFYCPKSTATPSCKVIGNFMVENDLLIG